jgi:hypothetical protein
MDMQSLWIPHKLPGLNELLDAKAVMSSSSKRRWSAYNSLKKQWAANLTLLARSQGFQRVDSGYFTYLFIEPNQKRDKSNVIGAGVKLIEDSLVKAELLADDGWKNVLDIRTYVVVTTSFFARAGVLLIVHPLRVLDEGDFYQEAFRKVAA